MVALAAVVLYFMSRHETVAVKGPVTVVFAGLQNGTGDSSLDGVLASGLAMATAQSPHIFTRSTRDYVAALRAGGENFGATLSAEQVRAAARSTGAGMLVSGGIRPVGAGYELSLRLFDLSTGRMSGQLYETASSREQIIRAIDRLSVQVRSALGEDRDSITQSAIPLSREATSNLDALQSFSSGLALEASGNMADALLAYQRAANLDPHFTQADYRLAELYREAHAEVASAQAAKQAESSSANASPRLQALARAANAIYSIGDYNRAAEILGRHLSLAPADAQALDALALAQFLGGKFGDALATAQHVLQLSQFDAKAVELQALSLIAQGRPDSVDVVADRAQGAGHPTPDILAIANAGAREPTDIFIPDADVSLPPMLVARLLDAAGHLTDGLSHWQRFIDAQRSSPNQISAASYAESVAALDRALVGECAAALSLAHDAQTMPSGAFATFNVGEAEALCTDADGAQRSLSLLNSAFGQGTATQGFLAPDLSATIAWKAGDAAGALTQLDTARTFDAMSLSPYLRGLIDFSTGHPDLSVAQFQSILSHRGPATLFYAEIYPLAQLGQGRAYAAEGDAANSSVAYARFLESWASADSGLAVMAEARNHSRP